MNELKEIYDRITFLRGKGIKMKEMAEQAQLTPSVLSAMYSTVFPAYFKNVEKGMDDNEALDNALMWVNNLSKKKLFRTTSANETGTLRYGGGSKRKAGQYESFSFRTGTQRQAKCESYHKFQWHIYQLQSLLQHQ